MPHSNRSLSSPSPRDPSKPALDELPLPRSYSMSSSRLPLSRSYSIRSLSTRRLRPSVASIADVFVGSLVLAGFCHEHSPRGHTFSTLSIRASEPNLRGLRRNSRQYNGISPTQKHLGISGFSVQQSRRGSWLSHSPTPSEPGQPEKPKSPSLIKEEEETNNNYYVLPRLPEAPDSSSHQPMEDRFFDSIWRNEALSVPANKESSDVEDTEKIVEISPEPQASLPHDERVRNAVSSTLDRLLGPRFDWTEALDLLAPIPVFNWENDGSRDVMESISVTKLVDALPSSERSSEQYLFRLYRRIPSPGVAYLSKNSRARLLRRLATPPNRRAVDARRFLAVVDDMIAAGLPMTLSLWSSAIHMAGRSSHGRLPKQRLVKAIGLWQHMEHVAGIKADAVTFNILFEIATKANQFVVADRLEEEMKSRGLSFSRMGRVSKIYACGMRKDLPGIRENFNDFVAAGDVVDTVVLNSLMAAFLRAGDVETAEQLYAQMLQTQVEENKRSSGSKSYGKNRASLSPEFTYYRAKTRRLAHVLQRSKDLRKRMPSFHRELQDSLSLVPDTRTFYIWLHHSVRVTGDLRRFMNVLQDMENTYEVPPRYLIYLLLFEGFATHGRSRKRLWTADKLRLTWVSFLHAVRDSHMRRKPSVRERPSMIWDNPLKFVDLEAAMSESGTPDRPDELYMHLPSADSQTRGDTPEKNPVDPQDQMERLNIEDKESVGEESVGEESVDDDAIDFEATESEYGSISEEELVDDESIDVDETESEHDPISDEHQDEESLADMDFSEAESYQRQPLTPQQANDVDSHHYGFLAHRLENGVFVGRRIITLIIRAFGTCLGPDEVLEAWLQLEPLWVPSQRRSGDVLAVKEVIDEEMARRPPKNVRYGGESG